MDRLRGLVNPLCPTEPHCPYWSRRPPVKAVERKLAEAVALIAKLEADNAELNELFDSQHRRTVEADALWRAEKPETRALKAPDLGTLITWLIARTARITELEAIARVVAAVQCRCDEAYILRGRHEPNSWHSDYEDTITDARAYFVTLAGVPPTTEEHNG